MESVDTKISYCLTLTYHLEFVLQLKVDKIRLMEICGTSDLEFGNVSNNPLLDCTIDISTVVQN